MEKSEIKLHILRMLIQSPRATNKELAQGAGISEPTAARYRKELEDKGIVRYMTFVNNGADGTGTFSASKLYVVVFRQGITRSQVTQAFMADKRQFLLNKHVFSASVGDYDGRACITLHLESRVHTDFVDILNGELLPMFQQSLGEKCVHDIVDVNIQQTLKMLHNYNGPQLKVSDGSLIFVSDKLQD